MERIDKYERLYRQGRNVCGPPSPDIVEFFEQLERSRCTVLDMGCGQGRDALFIARKGHRVVGVDASKTGIGQMLADAREESLEIEGVIDDIVTFVPDENFDIVLFDRVLHMLPDDNVRRTVLDRACRHTTAGGFILIADMPQHKNFLRDFFEGTRDRWETVKDRKGILFLQSISEGNR